jgi:hypothetical protein
MPKTDAMRLIHDQQRRAWHALLRQGCLFVELLCYSLNLIMLQRKERRDDHSGIRKQVLLPDYLKQHYFSHEKACSIPSCFVGFFLRNIKVLPYKRLLFFLFSL